MTKAEQKKILERKKKLLERKAEIEQKLLIDSARNNYADYIEMVHQGLYQHAKHTRLICEKLQEIEQGKLKRLAIFMPPRHSKSQTVTETFPSWYIGRNPNKRVIQTSYGDDLACDFGLKNRQKIEDFGKFLFGVELDTDKQAKADWAIKGKQGYMRSSGILSGITGKGASLIIIDDPVKNSEEAESELQRERIWNEYKTTLLSRLTPDGAIILIMTRWHEDDLAGRILKEESGWEVLSLPCEAEEDDLLGRKKGEPLWPEFGFNEKWVKKNKKRFGQRVWDALYQQRPSAMEGSMIKIENFKRYKEIPDAGKCEILLQSWDMTFKDSDGTDYVVGQVWGNIEGNIYLFDQIRGRMDFNATLEAVQKLTKKWRGATIKLIEDKANGPAVISSLRKKIGGIVPVNPRSSKQARVSAVTPLIDNGNVWIPKFSSFTDNFLEECRTFPNGKHDDCVDAMSQGLSRFKHLIDMMPDEEVVEGEEEDDEEEFEGNWLTG